MDRLSVDLSLESHPQAPKEVVLGSDATGIPLDGQEPERFFLGVSDAYCDLPLSIFAQDQLLGVRLRRSNPDAAEGSLDRDPPDWGTTPHPWAPRARSCSGPTRGFCREEIMAWGEANPVDFLFGLIRSERLYPPIEAWMEQAHRLHESTGKPARVFSEFADRPLSRWSRERPTALQSRVVGERKESALCRPLSFHRGGARPGPGRPPPAQALQDRHAALSASDASSCR
ncbi:transposase [Methylacidimicrobium sp. B4]|uniref:transposase n=1 Tax=Methylacidimicrobium sp. B4 TaxID=2796139 RepID=UPI001F5C9EB0|nr:transposase [Methylacidimicrobium sp. B4]